MKYMLDTNTIAYAKNQEPKKVLAKFKKYQPEDFCISSITLAELECGVQNSSKPVQNRIALIAFLSRIKIVPFEANAAREYGQIRYDLKTRGELIGANDLFIAAHAKALGVTLITNNTKEFTRVEGLKIENWA